MAEPLERLPGTALRILATNDLGAAYLPVKTSWGALVGARRWHDVAALPIAAAAAGNHDFDDGLPSLPFPLLCANADAGLPPATLLETGAGRSASSASPIPPSTGWPRRRRRSRAGSS